MVHITSDPARAAGREAAHAPEVTLVGRRATADDAGGFKGLFAALLAMHPAPAGAANSWRMPPGQDRTSH